MQAKAASATWLEPLQYTIIGEQLLKREEENPQCIQLFNRKLRPLLPSHTIELSGRDPRQ